MIRAVVADVVVIAVAVLPPTSSQNSRITLSHLQKAPEFPLEQHVPTVQQSIPYLPPPFFPLPVIFHFLPLRFPFLEPCGMMMTPAVIGVCFAADMAHNRATPQNWSRFHCCVQAHGAAVLWQVKGVFSWQSDGEVGKVGPWLTAPLRKRSQRLLLIWSLPSGDAHSLCWPAFLKCIRETANLHSGNRINPFGLM